MASDAAEVTPIAVLTGRKDIVAGIVVLIAASGIAANALFLQKGPHPSPIFHARPQPAPSVPQPAPVIVPVPDPAASVQLPRPRPAEAMPVPATPAAPPAPARSQTDIVIDIQKELARRGFYDGVADGVYGPKTDAAIRDFQQAAGVKSAAEPSEAFLAVLSKSTVKAPPPPVADTSRPPDPIAEIIAPPKRVLAVQRALTDYGYGQLKVTGILDRDTQAAIEQFERARKLPVTGQISARLMRELSALTGRPLE